MNEIRQFQINYEFVESATETVENSSYELIIERFHIREKIFLETGNI